MTLDELRPGAQGVIAMVEGRSAMRQRLLDMGLTPGVRVRVIKRAPLGDPLEIEVRGYSLSLRGEDARHVVLR